MLTRQVHTQCDWRNTLAVEVPPEKPEVPSPHERLQPSASTYAYARKRNLCNVAVKTSRNCVQGRQVLQKVEVLL